MGGCCCDGVQAAQESVEASGAEEQAHAVVSSAVRLAQAPQGERRAAAAQDDGEHKEVAVNVFANLLFQEDSDAAAGAAAAPDGAGNDAWGTW